MSISLAPSSRILRFSDVQENGRFVGEDLLFDTHNWSIHGVIDVGQVVLSRSLSHSTELVIDGTVTEANPTLVSSEIGYRDATQVSANS
jgi:hypothetical protein